MLKLRCILLALLMFAAVTACAQSEERELLPITCVQTSAVLQVMEAEKLKPFLVGRDQTPEGVEIAVIVWFSIDNKNMLVTQSWPDGKTCILTAGEKAKFIVPGLHV
jgi:hypothetical protein